MEEVTNDDNKLESIDTDIYSDVSKRLSFLIAFFW